MASLVLSAGTLINQFLQFARLLLISAWFGASSGLLDGYFAALRWPLLVLGILTGAMISVVLPLAMKAREAGKYGESACFMGSGLLLSAVTHGVLLGFLALFPKEFLQITLPGLSEVVLIQATSLFRWCLILVLFQGLADLITAYFQLHRRFLPGILIPTGALALSIIYLVLFRNQGPSAVLYGSVAGALFQFVTMIYLCRRYGGFRLTRLYPTLMGLKEILYPLVVMVFVLCFSYFTLVADLYYVSQLPKGSISTLEYSSRLFDVIQRLSVVSLASALFPAMGFLVAAGGRLLYDAVKKACLVSTLLFLPLGVQIFLYSEFILTAVFQRGNFTITDTRQVALYWGLLCFSLVSSSVVHLTARAFQTLMAYRQAILTGSALLFCHIAVLQGSIASFGLGAVPLAHGTSLTVGALLSLWFLYKSIPPSAHMEKPEHPSWLWPSLTLLIGFLLLSLGVSILVHGWAEQSVNWSNPSLLQRGKLLCIGLGLPGFFTAFYIMGLIYFGVPGLERLGWMNKKAFSRR